MYFTIYQFFIPDIHVDDINYREKMIKPMKINRKRYVAYFSLLELLAHFVYIISVENYISILVSLVQNHKIRGNFPI